MTEGLCLTEYLSPNPPTDEFSMNFFGSNSVNTGPTALTVAKIEAELMTEMFNK
jgi:hypothetical protein